VKALVIIGHPRPGSFSHALAEAYLEGARSARAEVRVIDLANLDFDPILRTASPRGQPLEPDLAAAAESIRWAERLVLFFPTWWGSMPALLKGFLDRVLLPGEAFEEIEGGTGIEGQLAGRAAHLFATMDTPPWVYRWLLKEPGFQSVGPATLSLCGIQPIRRTAFGPVKGASAALRKHWLAEARRWGEKLAAGGLTRGERAARKLGAWIRALRLQFYPMPLLAYTLGWLAATGGNWGGAIGDPRFWLGYACLFCLEATTVFLNERFDFPSDRRNRCYGPFTGGSRVLVEDRLTARELSVGAFIALAGASLAGLAAVASTPDPAPAALALLALAALAIGYTVPPLKLCWRGFGELTVAVTHSAGVLLPGYFLAGGSPLDSTPWLLCLPLGLAVLPSIALAGIPDRHADASAGKRTFAARYGARRAAQLAAGIGLMAAATVTVLAFAGAADGLFAYVPWLALPHAVALAWLLMVYAKRSEPPARIDALLITALTFILPFVAAPLARL
jgi:1,4-dihydroxy-2-naphthoate polyprenyltransferase